MIKRLIPVARWMVKLLLRGAVLCWPLGVFGGWWRWLAEAAWLTAVMACWITSRWQSSELARPRAAAPSVARFQTAGLVNRWPERLLVRPDRPLVPDEWADASRHHELVVAAVSGGFCPEHSTALNPADGSCRSCEAAWELAGAAETADASGAREPATP
jgi:hypothetical protein